MGAELDRILMNSERANLLEVFKEKLQEGEPKIIIILINDKDDGKYDSQVLLLGINNGYEALGILEIAKEDIRSGESLD